MKKKKIRLLSLLILFTVVLTAVCTVCVLSVKTAAADLKTAEMYGERTELLYKAESLGAQRLSDIKAAVRSGEKLPEDTALSGDIIYSKLTFESQCLEMELRVSGENVEIISWKNYAVRSEPGDLNLFGS